jgi:diaminobutyrate-2-oxoglutarate transaminase
LSKSLSGYGLPLSIVLFKPELDVWAPGEHNGTFRGNNHAFITAATALQLYWSDKKFEQEIQRKGHLINSALRNIQDKNKFLVAGIKGKGMMQGIECHSGDIANQVCQHAFERGLIIETAGNRGQVVKCFCPLTISESDLRQGMEILEMSFAAVKAVQATPKSA